MSKVAATYWDNSSAVNMKKKRAKTGKASNNATPEWFAFACIALLTFMICIAINIRAFSELYAEMSEHNTLNSEIEQLEKENSVLQKEIENLKSDSQTIEREAIKFGMSRPK